MAYSGKQTSINALHVHCALEVIQCQQHTLVNSPSRTKDIFEPAYIICCSGVEPEKETEMVYNMQVVRFTKSPAY